MLNLKRFAITVAALFILLSTISYLNNLDLKIAAREAAWQNSVQALQMEQEKVGNEIMILRDQLENMGKEVGAQSVLIWDIRERVHLDIGWEIEQEKVE